MIRLKKDNIYMVFLHILCFMVVINSASIWVQEEMALIPIGLLKYMIWLLAVLLAGIHIRRVDSRFGINMFLIIGCTIGYSIFNIKYINISLNIAFIPMLVFYFVAYTNENQIRKVYNSLVNVMCLMAVISLIFYMLASILGIISPTGYYSYEWSWVYRVPSYYNLYYEPMPTGLQDYLVTRNCGIFPEAPMFCFPLCVALGLQELILKKSRVKSIILVITIITTFSTTGYLFLIGLYGYKFIKQKGFNNAIVKIGVVIAGLTVATYLAYTIFINKTATGSYSVRSDHISACLLVALKTGFLGGGIGNTALLEKYMSYKQGASIGFLYLFALGGIFSILPIVIPMIQTAHKALKVRNTDVIFFTILFFYLIFVTNIIYRNIMWFIVAVVFMCPDGLLNCGEIQWQIGETEKSECQKAIC